MSETASCNSGGGCGCFGLVLTIFVLWSIWAGISTPWGWFKLDIFPPAIHLEKR